MPINSRVYDSAPKCPSCNHKVVYTTMWHHINDNNCNCMCDRVMQSKNRNPREITDL